MRKDWKLCKIFKFERDWDELWAKVFSTESRGQNIWQQVKNSSKIRQDKRILITFFFLFLIAISENFTFAGTLGATFGPHLILGFSLYFLISLSLTFKLFGNVWGSLHTKSLITWMKDICICYSLNIVIMNYLIAIMNCNNEHTSNSKSFILYIKRNKKNNNRKIV